MATAPAEIVSTSLQEALADLIDLSLQGKQAHWNVHGPHFRSVHLQLDTVIDDVRIWSDDVAERLVTLGGTPDGRAGTVATSSQVEKIDGGPLSSDKVVRQFAERLTAAAARINEHLPALDSEDLLTQDLLIDVARGLEKHAWMFRAAEG
ncbi:Ferritin Dps family protein [Beutenbergia cavernae DSM 12333]|uniref:Ferritin Dps family protein n=1 Tax=Beutenbergia cavernae (strain ATCC BAA-8 / DSM 12333 / CCUG 43141 / JCM 11478 / NBRC 16432 / NCIMB 13614 / HKI 0122) TaxID=471853 RepID=C5C472_BEUC1|nr:DNA starvation/stationary phase protection protein [Beutenbergia cavernae]ACQ79985.1 Ferritin Dps family protein [Beutenbergia cavernae DSM 12333]